MERYLQHTISDFVSLDSNLCVQWVAPLQTLALFSQRTTNSQFMLFVIQDAPHLAGKL